MRVAVTGATGNLGSALLRRIRSESGPEQRHQVLGVSRRPPDAGPAGPAGPADPWLPLDLSRPEAVAPLTEALHGYDALVHLAWKIQPGRDEAELKATNVDGTAHVLSAARAAGIPHVVVISSVGAYSPGSKTTAVEENWPTDGISTSSYSRHKAQVERLLDVLEQEPGGPVVSRVRPGLVFQGGAASEIARLFLGPLVPRKLLGRLRLPFLPLPPSLVFQGVHADDVATAIWTVLDHQAPGAFNVAADPVLTPDHLAVALGVGRAVPLPTAFLRTVVDLTWRGHLQPTDPGWIDLATQCPIMSTRRLRELGWRPTRTSTQALAELVTGMRQGDGDAGLPPLVPGRGSVDTAPN